MLHRIAAFLLCALSSSAVNNPVVTHDRYAFYNPVHDAFLDQAGGRLIYFEGTYAATFSRDGRDPTPRYDYNQMMYRLDLADPRLRLPPTTTTAPG